MNEDIKQGAVQLAKGLKEEAKVITENVKEYVGKTKEKLDPDKDGKIQFDEAKEVLMSEAKDGLDKLKALVKDEETPLKVKATIMEAMDKLKPVIDATKMEAEIAKEKIEAKIEHIKEVEEVKEEVKAEVEEAKEELE